MELGDPGSKVLVVGSRSSEMAAVAALAAKEAEAHPTILDIDGALARRLSGHFETFDYHSFLYDAFRLETPESWHSQLVAAAYATALDLYSEEEAIIDSALQAIASEVGMASPLAIFDVMSHVEGFRGFYVDKLKGRVGSLRLFDAVDDRAVSRLMQGDAIVDFHGAPYPAAAELSIALFLAKMLTISHASGPGNVSLLLTQAHRAFHATPRSPHRNRLITHLLGWPIPQIMATDQSQALNREIFDACAVRLYCSDAWHSLQEDSERIPSGSYMLADDRIGTHEVIIPRLVLSKTGAYVAARASKFANPRLTAAILEQVEAYPLSTAQSVVQFLTPEFLPADTAPELTRLQTFGYLILEPKDSWSGSKIFAYTLSEKGRGLLKELRT